jgi:hypothetical protein
MTPEVIVFPGFRKSAAFAVLLAASYSLQAKERYPLPLDLPLNEGHWVATHNAFASHDLIVRNQNKSISRQLDDGVRGLMLDLHNHRGAVYVCHESCNKYWNASKSRLRDWFDKEILPFLAANPQAVISLFLEDNASRPLLQAELAAIPALAGKSFDPSTWSSSQAWPTLRQLVDKGQRLLLFTYNNGNAGTYRTGSGTVTLMKAQDALTENYWSLGNTIGQHDNSCVSRWSGIPLNRSTVGFPGKSWPRLFVMNHFHGQGEANHANIDNRFDTLQRRVDSHCRPAAGRAPNYIAVDFYEHGDPLEYAGVLSRGGVILHEGNRGSQDIVCGIPYQDPDGFTLRASNEKTRGCENDEARSATLVNIKKGATITLYDSPSGSANDDWTTIVAKKDIGTLTIDSFEANRSDDAVDVTHIRNNGLDGKVSYVELGQSGPPSVVLYEGSNATQNIVCTIRLPTSGTLTVNFKNDSHGCDNDEARSMKLLNVKAGTTVTVFDDPNAGSGDDLSIVTIYRDAGRLVVPDFEKKMFNAHLVLQHFRKNGLNGKVSSIRLKAPLANPPPFQLHHSSQGSLP